MSGVSESDMPMAQRISVLRCQIDKSLMELTEVEIIIDTKPHPRSESGRLHRERLLLTSLIVEMDGKLKRLQARSNDNPNA